MATNTPYRNARPIASIFRNLSPLRIARAQELVSYLEARHAKHFFTRTLYGQLEADLGLPAYAVDCAIEDLWSAGLIVMRIAGGLPIVSLRNREEAGS